jgi:hypothetical protein
VEVIQRLHQENFTPSDVVIIISKEMTVSSVIAGEEVVEVILLEWWIMTMMLTSTARLGLEIAGVAMKTMMRK